MARAERKGGFGRKAVATVVAASMVGGGFVVTSAAVAGASGSGSSCQAAATATSSQLNSTTGITKSTVTVGNISIISGPVPGLFQGAAYGAQSYFAYLNSKGGVNGRKIQLKSYDDAFSGTQNQSEAQTSVGSNFANVGSFSLFDNYSCNVLAQNPAEKEKANQYKGIVSKLMNAVKGFQQRLQQKMQAEAKAAQGGNGNDGGAAAKSQAIVLNAATKAKTYAAHAAMEDQHREKQFQAEEKRKDASAWHEIQRKRLMAFEEPKPAAK